ncbi:hypothetical protein E4T38_05860 [Aureobasidium subglaciale]|nr:hypothetical protein E4T38_05860 [Aureobasidium subglaciale]KAI5220878.1 hypothetical protein E4T40_05791 [Aureobasidium subglaciale]KAI5224694.1 hypothetical protein E4T41_05550 [Aureobasidium subglaciale]KAI5260875.1 hypothetical protein E4T46_05614 [Aureobasidium subglaciale]
MLGLSTILKVVKISQPGKLLEANASCFKKMQTKTFAMNLIKAIRMRQHQDSIDIGDLFFRMTTDFATGCLYSEATESLERGPDHGFCEAFTGGLRYVGKLSRTGRLGLPSGYTKFRHESKYLYDFIDRYVDRTLENVHDQEKSGQRHTSLHELSQQTTDVVRIRTGC